MLYLRKPTNTDATQVKTLYARSVKLHQPWTFPPKNIDEYIQQPERYFLCLDSDPTVIGTFHISGIVRGYFQSAYLGYEVFEPYAGKGYMREGLTLLINEAFGPLNLHRLEANIQPGNIASIKLVKGAGFVKEGFSKAYLNVGGKGWKDHERWAIINDNV